MERAAGNPLFLEQLLRHAAEEAGAPGGVPGSVQSLVQARLDRDWTVRRVMIGAAGIVGGVLAASQAFGSGVLDRLQAMQLPSAPLLHAPALRNAVAGDGLALLWGGGEVVWLAAGLIATAAVFLGARLADQA